MKGFKFLLAALVVLCFSPALVQAETIKIGLTAVVDSVFDPCALLGNKIKQGDAVTGFYTYDSLVPDSLPLIPNRGGYHFSSGPFGISLMAGDIVFLTDSTRVDFGINIENDLSGDFSLYDTYHMYSVNNITSNGLQMQSLHWDLYDPTGTAISTDQLPLAAPDLAKWISNGGIVISGGIGGIPGCYDESFRVSTSVTSVYLVPEPAALFLFGLSGLLLRRKGKTVL
jgi:hypothetical protein